MGRLSQRAVRDRNRWPSTAVPNGPQGAVPRQPPWSVWWQTGCLGSGSTAQRPRQKGNDAEGVTGRPCAPPPGDGRVGHTWLECPHHRAPDDPEMGLTWLAIAIETNKGEHNRLDHATRLGDPCRMAQRASSPSPKNRFRRKRPWRTPALSWTTGVPSRPTRPSRSGGSRARTRNASCGKAWPSCAWA